MAGGEEPALFFFPEKVNNVIADLISKILDVLTKEISGEMHGVVSML